MPVATPRSVGIQRARLFGSQSATPAGLARHHQAYRTLRPGNGDRSSRLRRRTGPLACALDGAGWDDEHIAPGVAQHVSCYGPEQRISKASTPVRAEHEQVSGRTFDRSADHQTRGSEAHVGSPAQNFLARRAGLCALECVRDLANSSQLLLAIVALGAG